MPTLRPNHHALALAAIMLAMWYAGAAQQNGGAYILAFLTGSVALLSWIYAKANLRSLKVELAPTGSVAQGGKISLPLILSTHEGASPSGIEITAENAVEAVHVPSLNTGRPTLVHLQCVASMAGLHATKIIVRSRYPLGFFTAERVFILQGDLLVHPLPAGDLPLPDAVKEGASHSSQTKSKSNGSTGSGDDFAGLREWQPGDSLRQVDWKAVARERPMMVKLWTPEAKGLVWLNWEACPAPVEARPAQFADWIQKAEASGLQYGLRLPQKVVQPSSGPHHRRQCLDELARLQPPRQVDSQVALPSKAPTTEHASAVPGDPFYFLGVAMVLAGLPMVGGVPLAGIIVYYVSIALHWYWQKHKLPLLHKGWRIVFVIAGILGCWLQGGSLIGIETGVGVLMAVLGGKVLESRNAHDLQVVASLGWFLCLCAVALDQGLSRCLFVLGVFALLTAAMIRMRRGEAGIRTPIRLASILLAQALPLVLLLFPLFPRLPPSAIMQLNRQLGHQTGISGDLDPGSVASIAVTSGRAFWVNFPEERAPEMGDRYWRCMVLWRCNGLSWRHGITPHEDETDERLPLTGREIRQRITLDPHGGKWLPALEFPTHVMSHMTEHELVPVEGILRSTTEVTSIRRYDVGSRQNASLHVELSDTVRSAATRLPADLSPAVKELAQSFQKAGAKDFQIANTALNYFRNHDFKYTLTPEKSGPHALDEFLFDRRLGFCEHFAAAFATLMRASGVPARVVIGYLGGEYSERWDHYTIHQSDAHAWCELWYEGRGWTRVDPTAALAPGRMGTDLRTYLEGGLDSAFAHNQNTWWGRSLNEIQSFTDYLNYQWYTRVVQFDEDDQEGLYNGLLRVFHKTSTVVLMAGLVFVMPLLGVWLWLRRSKPAQDPAVRAWNTFCRKLARVGIPRQSNEGPTAYAGRAAKALPQAARNIQAIGNLYVDCRYGGNDSVMAELKKSVRTLKVRRP